MKAIEALNVQLAHTVEAINAVNTLLATTTTPCWHNVIRNIRTFLEEHRLRLQRLLGAAPSEEALRQHLLFPKEHVSPVAPPR